jgi:hypothetical protein
MVERSSNRPIGTPVGDLVESPDFASRILEHKTLSIEAAMNRAEFQTLVGVRNPAKKSRIR